MTSSARDIVNNIINGDISDIEKDFDSLVRDRINGLMDAAKQEIGSEFDNKED